MHRNILGVVWLSSVVCHQWLFNANVINAQPQKEESVPHTEAGTWFSLSSEPLPTPITFAGDMQAAQVTSTELSGKLPDGDTGTAELTLGENTYSFNAFGDAEIKKQKPPRKLSVQLHRKSVGKHGSAFEITAADLPLEEKLFLLRRTGPGQPSELVTGNTRNDGAGPRGSIDLEPKKLVVLNDQTPHEIDAKYRQRLRNTVSLYSNHFRAIHAEKDRLGSIQLYGELSGKGSLTHDMNQWGYSLSPKWMSSYSTAVGYYPQPVHFRRLDLRDPTEQNRRIYRLEFERPSNLGDVSLVTWPEAIGPHRLVISQGGQVNQILTLSIGGLSLWEELQPETQKLSVPERTALAQLSEAVPENFFYRFRIKEDHVVSVILHGDEMSRESLAILPEFSQLQSLFVTGDKVDAADLAAVVKKLTSLRSLRGDDIPVSEALFKAAAELPKLTTLYVYNHDESSAITDEHLKLLSTSRSIKNLSLGAEQATDAGLLSLADMPQLTALSCSARQLTAEGAKEFCSRRPNCKLNINGESYRGN